MFIDLTATMHTETNPELERLEADMRVLSPVGIERAAWGWERHGQGIAERYHEVERAALHAIEQHDAGEEWDEWRRRLFYEVEGRLALVAWKAEHQLHAQHVHKAERGAFAAALALFARPWISHEQYATLASGLAEALPWLLPEQAPSLGPG